MENGAVVVAGPVEKVVAGDLHIANQLEWDYVFEELKTAGDVASKEDTVKDIEGLGDKSPSSKVQEPSCVNSTFDTTNALVEEVKSVAGNGDAIAKLHGTEITVEGKGSKCWGDYNDTEADLGEIGVMSSGYVVAWNAMIHGYVRFGDLVDARELFDMMQEKDLVSDTAMVDGYAKYGDLVLARHLLEQCEKKEVFLWSALILGYAQNARRLSTCSCQCSRGMLDQMNM